MDCANCNRKLTGNFLLVKEVENGFERDIEIEDVTPLFCGFSCLQEYLNSQPLTVMENW
jgi:hypothetical protein